MRSKVPNQSSLLPSGLVAFPEMYAAASGDNILTLPRGIKAHADLSFSGKIFEALRDLAPGVGLGDMEHEMEGHEGGMARRLPEAMDPEAPMGPEGMGPEGMGPGGMGPGGMGPPLDIPKMLSAITLFKQVNEIRYRSIDEIADAAKGLPSFDELVDKARNMVGGAPPPVLKRVHGLSESADGLDSVEVTGFPKNYKLKVTFTNFHLTPVFKSLIDEAPKHGGPGGEHGGPGPGSIDDVPTGEPEAM